MCVRVSVKSIGRTDVNTTPIDCAEEEDHYRSLRLAAAVAP